MRLPRAPEPPLDFPDLDPGHTLALVQVCRCISDLLDDFDVPILARLPYGADEAARQARLVGVAEVLLDALAQQLYTAAQLAAVVAAEQLPEDLFAC